MYHKYDKHAEIILSFFCKMMNAFYALIICIDVSFIIEHDHLYLRHRHDEFYEKYCLDKFIYQ